MKHVPLHWILAASIAGGTWVAAAAPQGGDETLGVAINVTGSIAATRREADGFTVENWTMTTHFTQSSELTWFRAGPKIGGAPTSLFAAMRAQGEDLFQPIPSPFDPMTHDFSGEVRVTGCTTQRSPLKAGMKVPTGVPVAIDIGGVAALAEKGMYFVQLCAANPDRVLVFYQPPPGFYSAPSAGPLKCTDDYSYQRDEQSNSVFDSSLVEEKSAAAAARACPGHSVSGTDAESMVFVGGASWRALVAGTPVTLTQTLQGSEGDRTANETSREMTVTLTLAIQPHKRQ